MEVLATFDLEWWVARLRPILDEFVRTADGEPDRAFWQAIIKPQRVYVTDRVTGWIADLFPYLKDPPERRRNPVFDTPRENWGVPKQHGIPPKAFPSGFSQVPVRRAFPDRPEQSADLMAGFFGVGQNDSDKALYPIISWAMPGQKLSLGTLKDRTGYAAELSTRTETVRGTLCMD